MGQRDSFALLLFKKTNKLGKSAHWKFTCTIAGEENPNISKPSRLPGGCKGGRFILPDLCCFVISWFTLSLTISQHLAAET
jgi:hypothetical protein